MKLVRCSQYVPLLYLTNSHNQLFMSTSFFESMFSGTADSLLTKNHGFLSFLHISLVFSMSWYLAHLSDMTIGSDILMLTVMNSVTSLFPYAIPVCPLQSDCDKHVYQTYLKDIPPSLRVCDLCQLELTMKKRYGFPLVYRIGNSESYPIIPYGKEMYYLNVPYISPNEHHYLLILVASGAKEVGRRMLLREYYRDLGMKSIRFIFITASDPDYNEYIDKESWIYGDILQMSHVDCYHNLTLTTFGAIQFFSRFTEMAEFVMKTDSDCALNMPVIIGSIKGFNSSVNYAGNCQYNVTYNTRLRSAKNYVHPSLVRSNRFIREYATGAGYVIRWWLLPKIAIGIRHLQFIAHNEDINIGKVLVMFGVHCLQLDKWVARFGCTSREECLQYAIIHPDGKGTTLRSYWSYIL